MLDLHCHLLPSIDDGPRTIQQSIELARQAVLNGISHAVLTPHINPGTFNNNVHSIASAGLLFKVALGLFSIPLKFALAAEVRICPELMQMVRQDDFDKICLGYYGGNRVLLLEFPHGHIPPGSERLMDSLLNLNITPMLAHPERNKGFLRKPGRLEAFVEMGCMVQLTAGSVVGGFGLQVQKNACYFLRHGWVDVLASDAHNLNFRPPMLKPAVIAVEKLIGRDAAFELVDKKPFAIVKEKKFEN